MNNLGSVNEELVLRRLFHVKGARVVVTGAASGLGFAMAEVMAECGATVVLSDNNGDSLEEARRRLSDRGLRVKSYMADVSVPEQVEGLFQDTAQVLGGVDVVYANAGVGAGKSFRDPSGALAAFALEDWHRVMRINLDGVFISLQAAARVMKPQGSGSMIVTASTAGLRAEPRVGYAYAAAKAAVVNIVRQAALELAPYGIRVNGIAPGPFKTNIGGPKPRPPEVQAAWANTIPMARWGDPEEVKGVALLLASPAASFITGSIYTVDGGALALTQLSASELSTEA